MQMQNVPHVAVFKRFFIVSVAQEHQQHSFYTDGRLDDIRHILFVGERIGIGKILTGLLGMCAQVEIGAARNAPKLAPAERELVFYIGGAVGVMRKLGLLMLPQAHIFLVYAKGQHEVLAVFLPILVPVKLGAGRAEEFKLHLLKLAGTEYEVARGYLIAEGLTDLAYTERYLAASGALHVLEVYEYALRGFGTQIYLAGSVLVNALECFEHHVELADRCELALSAFGAYYAFFGNVCGHLLVRPSVGMYVLKAVLLGIFFNQLVSTETGLAALAVHKRVVEVHNVSAGYPNLGVHQYSGVETDVVFAFLHKFAPPCLFYVVFHLHAKRAVIPRVCKAAVKFGAGENKAAIFAKRNYFIHTISAH